MKTLFTKPLFLLLSLGILFSCSKDDGPGKQPQPEEPQLVLTASATETTTGEEISFEVTADGKPISDAEVFIDGVAISGNAHVFEDAGEYEVVAKKEGYTDSEPVSINAVSNLRLKTFTSGTQETNFSYNEDDFLTNWQTGSTVRNVIYDGENRVIQNAWWSYTYNSLSQITKITQPDNSTFENMEAEFIYNNKGLIAKSYHQFTYVSSGNTVNYTRTFEYNGDNQLVSMTEHETGGNYDRFLIGYDVNGNISQFKWQNSGDGTNFSDYSTETYTYDNKKNPCYATLNRMGVSSHLSPVYLMGMNGDPIIGNSAFFRINYYNPNNILTYTFQSSSGSYSRSFEYVYNEEGYPTAVEETRNNIDGTTDMFYRSWVYETY